MYTLRYYALIYRANGTISQLVKWHGPFDPDIWTPVQMWNERGQWIPQPYPDPPGARRSTLFNVQPDVWFVHWIKPPPQFQWVILREDQWDAVSNFPWSYCYNGAQIGLRPGHRMNERGDSIDCRYEGVLKRSHCAYGGMPIYQIRKEYPKRTVDDFPEIRDAGLFHPWARETVPIRIAHELQTAHHTFCPEDVLALSVEERHRVIAAPALVMRAFEGVMRWELLGFVEGAGAN